MKKRVSGILLAGLVLLSSSFTAVNAASVDEPAAAVKFIDIASHWSNGAVQNLLDKNAIPFTEDKFLPGKAVTKGEFVSMLHDALDIKIKYIKEPDVKDYFDDVKQDAPYTLDLIDLAVANIIDDKGSFKPDGTMTREQMIHYVMNAYKSEMGDRYAMINISPASFKDADEIMPEFSGDAARAQHYNLISGSGNNLFHPKDNATRAEAAVVVSRLLGLLDQQNQVVSVKPDATVNEDSIDMKISIINNSKQDVVFNHSSGQKYDFALLDADRNELYRWSTDKFFTMMLTSSTIETGKTLDFSETLSGDDFKAIKDKIVYLKAYIIGSSDSFDINEDGYEIKLK